MAIRKLFSGDSRAVAQTHSQNLWHHTQILHKLKLEKNASVEMRSDHKVSSLAGGLLAIDTHLEETQLVLLNGIDLHKLNMV